MQIDIHDNPLIYKHLNYNPFDEKIKFEEKYTMLNPEQKQFFDQITTSISDFREQQLFFLYGDAGSGKTFLFNTLLNKIRSKNQIALAMSSTGISSMLLEGGNTAHSTLRIPISANSTSLCNWDKNTTNLIRRTKLFIWDEAPTMNNDIFETVDRSFQDLFKSKEPFGGMNFSIL